VDNRHPVGCEILAEGTEPIQAEYVRSYIIVYVLTRYFSSIVFVHGLRGHQRDTWTKEVGNNQICWPKDLLPTVLPNVRVISFGYDANVVKLLEESSKNNIHDHSKDLLGDLNRVRLDTVRQLIRIPRLSLYPL
jgi:hypothetical protein